MARSNGRDTGGVSERRTAEPRAVVEELNRVINSRDPSGGADLFAPGATMTTATGRVLDLEGMGRLLTDTLAAFPDMQVSVARWVVDGDTVVTEEVLIGTHRGPFAGMRPTNQTVRLPMVHVTRVVDGRIVERVAYHDTAGVLRQLSERRAPLHSS